MKCRLVKVHRGKCREIHLWLRCPDGSKRHAVVTDFAPYFYVPSQFGLARAVDGQTVARVEAPCPEDVPKLREKHQRHYEADVPFARRFLIDTGITSCVEIDGFGQVSVSNVKPATCDPLPLKTWFIDIEVLAEEFPDPESHQYPVTMITVYDSYTNMYRTFFWHPSIKTPRVTRGYKVIRACGGEATRVLWELRAQPSENYMLMDFLSEYDAARPDILAGWNVGFDVDYLSGRMADHGLELPLGGAIVYDLLEAYRKLGPRQRSYALKEVTVAEGIECREDIKLAMDLMSGWERSPRDFLLYNLRDVWRIVELDRRHRLIDFYISMKEVVGLENITKHIKPGVYGIYPTLPIVDTALLRKAKERGIVLPTSGQGKRESYKGAVVLEPPGGLWEGVAVFDMSRYYPSLIISFNISPETKDRLVDPVNRIWRFREEPEGIIPVAVKDLLAVRERLEEELKKHEPGSPEYQDIENKIMAVKGIVNSFYGVMGNPYFRLFDVDVAATITGLAREGILYVVKAAEEMGYRALYGDTDSIFIQVPFDKAPEVAEELTTKLRRYFMDKYGLKREPVLKLKFEKYYARIFFKPRTKKRYAGLLVWKKGQRVDPPKLDVTGFEAVRTDVAPFTAYAQERVFEAILMGRPRQDIVSLIAELDREARQRPLSDIALYEGLQKDPAEYRTRPPHIRAALYSNMYLGTRFTKGSKVRYVYVKSVSCGYPPTDVVAFDADTEDRVRECFTIDWKTQLEKILYMPLQDILKSVGINITGRVVVHGFF